MKEQGNEGSEGSEGSTELDFSALCEHVHVNDRKLAAS